MGGDPEGERAQQILFNDTVKVGVTPVVCAVSVTPVLCCVLRVLCAACVMSAVCDVCGL